MNKIYVDYYPVFNIYLKIVCDDTTVLFTRFCTKKNKDTNKNDTTKLVITQLEEYFNGDRTSFELPIYLDGKTSFQKKVLNYLIANNNICISYGELAKRIGHINASRAVGSVMSRNNYPIIIPCHLVVGKYDLGHFTNASLDIKKKLIQLSTSK